MGCTYAQKRLSKQKVLAISNHLNFPIVFLGGEDTFVDGNYVLKNRLYNNTYNFCGKLTFDESAWLIKKSQLVLTNDTGFRHMSAAFQKKIISFWGCTKPILGMYPYVSNDLSTMIVSNPNKPPCSKLGNKCLYSGAGCINHIDIADVVKMILKKI